MASSVESPRPGSSEHEPGRDDLEEIELSLLLEAVREMPQFRELPIISLTAKAMQGDRDRSIASGASDYITKPVDTDQLLSLMRVWLYH